MLLVTLILLINQLNLGPLHENRTLQSLFTLPFSLEASNLYYLIILLAICFKMHFIN